VIAVPAQTACARERISMETIFFSAAALGGVILTASLILALLLDR
jgi:hypothetical protein